MEGAIFHFVHGVHPGSQRNPTPASLQDGSPNLVMLHMPWFRPVGSAGRLGTT